MTQEDDRNKRKKAMSSNFHIQFGLTSVDVNKQGDITIQSPNNVKIETNQDIKIEGLPDEV